VAALALRPSGSTTVAATAVAAAPVATTAVAAVAATPVDAAPGEASPTPASASEPESEYRVGGPWAIHRGRHQSFEVPAGTVQLDRVGSETLTFGALWGLVPGVLMPTVELSMHQATFLTLPGGGQQLLAAGVLRAGGFWGGEHRSGDTRTAIDGLFLSVGPAWSYFFDSEGFVLTSSIESQATFDDLEIDERNVTEAGGVVTTDILPTRERSVRDDRLRLSTFLQYNLASWLHVQATLSYEPPLSFFEARRADGSRLFRSGRATFRGGLGIGIGL
jgi:hypothetical protein